MAKKDSKWFDKNERLNSNVTIKIGDVVENECGRIGTVSEIRLPRYPNINHPKYDPIADHGGITTGGQEHYCWTNCRRFLRIKS